MLTGMALAFGWAWLMKLKPVSTATKAARLDYAVKAFGVTIGVILCLIGAGIGAIIIVRQARADYKKELDDNFRKLVTEMKEDDENDA
jgi:hypothetical protein